MNGDTTEVRTPETEHLNGQWQGTNKQRDNIAVRICQQPRVMTPLDVTANRWHLSKYGALSRP